MFSTYKRVFWLSVIMGIFMLAPFNVTGFSTDVWTRMARIREWANTGFPWGEQLTMMHNYPFGFEMHWTRPLDFIGYALAWPFIPVWGLKEALEIMAYFTPILIMLIAIKGFFFGVRGYLTPKMAFFVFWLFFYCIHYCWEQASIGYFDHHIFQFMLLVWTIALIARSCRIKNNRNCVIIAGILSALNTWITIEACLAIYFCLLPFLINWLYQKKSLKPAMIYVGAYTLFLLIAMLFDHPIAGFWTLDFYHTSLFHVVLGFMTLVWLVVLSCLSKRHSTIYRFGQMSLSGLCFVVILLLFWDNVILAPSADPLMYHFWMKKVTEMSPLYERWADMLSSGIIPIIMSIAGLIMTYRNRRNHMMPLWAIGSVGTLFYTIMGIFHIRFLVTQDAFLIFLACCWWQFFFFPRERSFYRSLSFIILYLLFIGSVNKGSAIVQRFNVWGALHYLELYKKDPTLQVPEYLKEAFDKAVEEDKHKDDENFDPTQDKKSGEKRTEDKSFSCSPSEKIWSVIKKDKDNGAIMTNIFSAPQILWETEKPVLAGPYHPNVEGITDLFLIQLDRPPYTRARELIKKHKITQILIENPACVTFLFENTPNKKPIEDADTTFYHAVYYETKNKPNWLTLEYHDKRTNIKIFRVTDSK